MNGERWRKILKHAKKVCELEDTDNEKYIVEYKDRWDGRHLDAMPRGDTPLIENRGYCASCNKLITEPVSDDRFCKHCYAKIFPDVWKRSADRNVTEVIK